MGFFSKKNEEPKKQEQKKEGYLAMGLECPICHKKNFIIQVTQHVKYDDKWGKFDNLIDATVFTDKKTGVCTGCGVVGFGELIYKSNNYEESMSYFEKLLDITAKQHLIFQKLIETASSDKLITEFDNAFNEVMNNIKRTDPVFFTNAKPDKFVFQSIKYVQTLNKK